MARPIARRASLAAVFACVAAAPLAAQARDATRPLDAAERRRALDTAAVLLEARYQDADLGRRLADSARAWARRDAFASVADPARLADSLGAALRAVVPDRHLYARHVPDVEFATIGAPASAPPAMVRRSVRVDPRDSATVARTNFGFARVERLEGNVGYVRLERLVPPDWARPTADAALAFVRHADAVILDLRDVPGGSPLTVQYLLSHFVAGPPTLLHASYARAEGGADSLWSVPALAERGLAGVPLYVLTSARTASAAEMLAYVARRTGVGTVVGETTRGAGNGGRPHTLVAGLHLFVPDRRVLTGPGWEQTGVAPDVATSASDALETARRLAGERVAAARATMR